ncbi:hypothetical protein COCC4DRAFT_200501 [Bipolaris maydis ATCC 48331]|uniref:Uncharacterized protein n=2 Tax=Cochliobolus heterostrophus TaxID=5016 RepID=M2TY23_COCH5|nr:uncharacterized protein COCC4DRAFT_200501 [Bipolaris maydis ATCC 48331]EMD86661.1 hypothetical protein COCHEDRAFT_1207108 [Bipolaris maydis C5]KAJ6203749.1 hypothetical protein PSV09DRAFT_1207108 [Bipolaris maydis]ENI03058.1 hypothetical protein COCC4DRAFT_200501 [Bipolaris maydis ATCC 48331]KAJ6267422.1 hypothetical protein PSV08DRAFT_208313 [Bipolaris maydis]KAJ6267626.1 hypothetical protein PSV08DRAFT_208481 [Bipolaris maydis]
MAVISSKVIIVHHIATPNALDTLLQSFDGLPNNPASLYLSTTAQNLIVYAVPTRTVSAISLPYLVEALRQKERSASALKTFSRLTCTVRNHIHEVQMMELALRRRDIDRMWLAGFDRCISRDSNLDMSMLVFEGLGRINEFDERILHLPVLWKKYHDRLLANRNGVGGPFWVARIRDATQKRLAVSCGETHRGYSVDSAKGTWDRESIEEQTDSWNDDVMMDAITGGEWLGGAEHWAKFDML